MFGNYEVRGDEIDVLRIRMRSWTGRNKSEKVPYVVARVADCACVVLFVRKVSK